MSQHNHKSYPPPPPPYGTPTGAPATDRTEERLRHGGVTFEEAVRARAYHLWEVAGRPPGDGVPFWAEAEQELSDVQ